jgi:Flp pilus assembly protein TadD
LTPVAAQTGRTVADETTAVLSIEGKVEVAAAGTVNWMIARTNQILHAGDRLRTDANSRALLRSSKLGQLRVRESSLLTIAAPKEAGDRPVLELLKGFFYFFNRDKAIEVDLHNRMASATTRGTEFLVEAAEDRMEVTVFEGGVDLRNDAGLVTLSSGEQGLAAAGQAPRRTAKIEAANLIQWCLYYPAILDADELGLNETEKAVLHDSLTAYRRGDAVGALRSYPENRRPRSEAERVYRAALSLSVGEVEQAQALLAALPVESRPGEALRELMAAVQFRTYQRKTPPLLATEWLAESYYRQSRASVEPAMLAAALAAAGVAVGKAPQCGMAWARLAELEFSFGRSEQALAALDSALHFSPQDAQALALKGFLLSAQNRIREAHDAFEQAIAADSGLANGWLGRGLCRIKLGRAAEGRADLLTAAALEPQRALLRSYLGKAFADAGDEPRAVKELKLARELDPKDPTSWLYAALLKQQQNRINEAIADLEASQERNDNRSLFRSRLLLDEDRAVRSANLASIYRDAGMTEVSVREAARAVAYDYANDSAHLFLADSYNELRDPTRFNLRYETVWFNELLLANLLSPVGGGRLAQHVSEQEYSRLFAADGQGLANSSLARTDGRVQELASQFGTFGRTSYALDLDYEHNYGVRPNNGLDSIEWYSSVKQQLTAQDTVLALVKYEDYHSGDNFQYYDPKQARKHFRFDENQDPITVGAWHHEWSPGMHTLLLGGRLVNDQHFSDLAAPQLLLVQDGKGTIYASDSEPFDVAYRGQLEIYTAEMNQIFEWDRVTLSLGGRYQGGEFNTQSRMFNPPSGLAFLFDQRATNTISSADGFERVTGYGYLTVEPIERVWLTGGLAYDEMTFPRNFRQPPISPGEDHRSQLGPKAAVVWSPLPQTTLRGVYTRSLGGVSLDESYRLEPTQLAGFPQAFRTLISESVAGSVAAPEYETYGLALDLKFNSRTYAGIQVERLNSTVRRAIGVYSLNKGLAPFVPASVQENLDYEENSLGASLNRLVGDSFVVGVNYKVDQAELHDVLAHVPVAALPTARRATSADLHQVGGYILFNHPSGFFARAEANWYRQSNSGYTPDLPGDSFWQENLFVGYRFLHRHAEVMLGVLNLSGQDYRLNPLTVYAELPREPTGIVQVKFEF